MDRLQQHFAQALLDPRQPVPQGIREASQPQQSNRFNVYRNNVVSSLIQAMRDGFGTVESLLGTSNFGELARAYVRANPPNSPVLLWYGDTFGDFIQGVSWLANYPYLADMARLDYARRLSYHAADFDEANDGIASCQQSAALAHALPLINPSMQLLCSASPVYDIWKHAHGLAKQQASGGQCIICLRRQGEVHMQLLLPEMVEFFRQLVDCQSKKTTQQPTCQSMQSLAAAALQRDGRSDISGALALALTSRAILGFAD